MLPHCGLLWHYISFSKLFIRNRELSKLTSLLSVGPATLIYGLANMFCVHLMSVASSHTDLGVTTDSSCPQGGTPDSPGRTADKVLWESFPAEGEALFTSITVAYSVPLAPCGRADKLNQWSNKTATGPPESNHNQFILSAHTRTLEATENDCSFRSEECHEINEIKRYTISLIQTLALCSEEGQTDSGKHLFFR